MREPRGWLPQQGRGAELRVWTMGLSAPSSVLTPCRVAECTQPLGRTGCRTRCS